MDNIKFYEYAFTILSEAGHVITSSPIYVNHEHKRFQRCW